MNHLYAEILGIATNADLASIKQAYRKLARQNHPDHFPPEERPLQELRMMQINEAYEYFLKSLQQDNIGQVRNSGASQAPPPFASSSGRNKQPLHESEMDMDTLDVGGLKDPAYAYYKQGFNEYSRGVGGMMLRGNRKITPDSSGLKRTIQALQHFESAYRYFQRVVQEHPDSIWSSDARYKLHRLERFRAVYQRIQKNLKNIRISQAADHDPDDSSAVANKSQSKDKDHVAGSQESADFTPPATNLADALDQEFGSMDAAQNESDSES